MNSKRLVDRIVAQKASSLAAALENEAREQGEALSVLVDPERGDGRGQRLLLSAKRLLERHFGSRNEAPDLLVSRLIQSLAQKQRQER
ncbi:hypothetical protein SAMN04515647_3067 [Cohaesibacter sp. ES.047]|uniref:hypothetical protein n=1 Tax=Cohaesibacter sp. ES.047 TaxID=1798205 RepID=UPI000BB835A6|nr:hypothetical protein [Cohaesibacter sp. ES.047]SNY92800.1 hypothetical protein SAMN04515647_3067 [Cohaesibacter sp. ES.047]